MKNSKTINEKIRDFFKYNYIPKFIKKRSVALLLDSDEMIKENFINQIPMRKKNSEIIEMFKKNHFNIIVSSDEHLKRISPLEVFFIHRTDMIIALDSDDFASQNIYRSAFNSPVLSMDTKCEKLYYFIDSTMNYRVVEKSKLKKYGNYENLFIPKDCQHEIFMIIDSQKKKTNEYISGLPLLSENKIIDFQTNYKTKVAVSKDLLLNSLNNNIIGALNFEIMKENGKTHIMAVQYGKDIDATRNLILEFIKEFTLSRNLKDEPVEINLNNIL